MNREEGAGLSAEQQFEQQRRFVQGICEGLEVAPQQLLKVLRQIPDGVIYVSEESILAQARRLQTIYRDDDLAGQWAAVASVCRQLLLLPSDLARLVEGVVAMEVMDDFLDKNYDLIYAAASRKAHEEAAEQTRQYIAQNQLESPAPEKHLLIRLAAALVFLGFGVNSFYFLWLELQLILENWLQILNPFLQLQVVYYWFRSPFTWQLVAITAAGYALILTSTFLVQWIEPRHSSMRWYWRWSATAFVKAPLFLLVLANFVATLPFVLGTFVASYERQWSVVELPLLLPVLSLYVALLPVPINHLIWDNRFSDGWRKLLLSVLAIAAFLGLYAAVNYVWADMLCSAQQVPSERCVPFQLYAPMRG